VHVTAVPSDVEPFMNCTVPDGACALSALLFELTVAVSVTDPPEVIELGLATTAVVVVACVIVTESVFVVVEICSCCSHQLYKWP